MTQAQYAAHRGVSRQYISSLAKRRVLAAWNRWVDQADYDRQHNAYGIQALAFRAMVVDGEALLSFYVSEAGALELQLLSAEFLDASINRENTVAGVEFDSAGGRSAYWVFEQHPGNVLRLPQSRRAPASEVLHLFEQQVAGQVRGISWLAPILLSLRDLDDFNRATVVKQEVAALPTGFITTPNDNPLAATQAADGAWWDSVVRESLKGLVDVRGFEPLISALGTGGTYLPVSGRGFSRAELLTRPARIRRRQRW